MKSSNNSLGDGPARVYSTTFARTKFSDFIQMASIDKTVIGFDRYGRVMAAIVPMDAVKMLAGRAREVDPQIREAIAVAAAQLLAQAPQDLGIAGFAEGLSPKLPKEQRSVVEIEQIEERRERRAKAASKSKKRARNV